MIWKQKYSFAIELMKKTIGILFKLSKKCENSNTKQYSHSSINSHNTNEHRRTKSINRIRTLVVLHF